MLAVIPIANHLTYWPAFVREWIHDFSTDGQVALGR
jgi:hypothetical protein